MNAFLDRNLLRFTILSGARLSSFDKNVAVVEEEGCKVYIVGTTHYSSESRQLVKEVVSSADPLFKGA